MTGLKKKKIQASFFFISKMVWKTKEKSDISRVGKFWKDW